MLISTKKCKNLKLKKITFIITSIFLNNLRKTIKYYFLLFLFYTTYYIIHYNYRVLIIMYSIRRMRRSDRGRPPYKENMIFNT